MKRNSTIPSIMIVESGLALPALLYCWLDELELDVLGPTDDLFDAYRLARDRQPFLAIVDKRIGFDCRQRLHTMLSSLKVPCFNLEFAARRRRESLAALERTVANHCGLATRKGLVSEPASRVPFTLRRANIGGLIVSSGADQTA